MIDYRNISLEELSVIERLSLHTELRCFNNGLLNLQVFIDHWKDHGTFRIFEHFGDQLDILLSSICNKYALLPLIVKERLQRETHLPAFIRGLDSVEKIMLCQQIALSTSNYATKTKSLIARLIQDSKTKDGILGLLYCEDFTVLQGIAVQTCSNLMRLKNRISAILLAFSDANVSGRSDAYNKILNQYLKTSEQLTFFTPEAALDRCNKIALFKLIDLLVNAGLVFSPSERVIFQSLYCGVTPSYNAKETETYKYSQTFEVKKKLREDLRSYLYCLTFIHSNDLSDYGQETGEDVIVLNAEFIRTVNEREAVKFSREFYENLLTVFFETNYSLLTGIKKVVPNGDRQRLQKKWAASYFIKNDLIGAFKFEDFVTYVGSVINTKRVTVAFLGLDEIVISFLNKALKSKFPRVKEICRLILSNEFNLTTNEEGQLILPSTVNRPRKRNLAVRNRSKNDASLSVKPKINPPVPRCSINDIVKILEHAGIPASMDFIMCKFKEQFPAVTGDVISVRFMILDNKETFFHIGNTGTYGLKVWQELNQQFNTQSIRDIAMERLRKSDTPMHVDDILTYIKQYRMITRDDLLAFCGRKWSKMFLKGNVVGLKNKKQHMDFELREGTNNHKLVQSLCTATAKESTIVEMVKSFDTTMKIMLCQELAALTAKLTKNVQKQTVHVIKNKRYELGIINLLNEISITAIKPSRQLHALKKPIATFIMRLQNVYEQPAHGNYGIVSTIHSNNVRIEDLAYKVIANTNGKIKLFKLIDLLVAAGLIFNHHEREIFFLLYSTKRLNDLHNPLNISKNSIYKIKGELEQHIMSYLLCLSFLDKNDVTDYHLDISTDIIVVNNDFAGRVNEQEEVNFNPAFYSKLLNGFLESSHILVGEQKTGLRNHKSKKEMRMKAGYFVKQELSAVFHFRKFIKYIQTLDDPNRKATYTINFKQCLTRFLKPDGKNKLRRINPVCQKIIANEFNLVTIEKGLLVFDAVPRKTPIKTLADYTREILTDFGKLTSLTDIINELQKRCPGLEVKRTSVLAAIRARKEFFSIGKTGYGLKIWKQSNVRSKVES